MLPSQGERLL
jgi:hypothetical protein